MRNSGPFQAWMLLMHALTQESYHLVSMYSLQEDLIWRKCANVFLIAMGFQGHGERIRPNLKKARQTLNEIDPFAFESFMAVGEQEGFATEIHKKILAEILSVELKVEEKKEEKEEKRLTF